MPANRRHDQEIARCVAREGDYRFQRDEKSEFGASAAWSELPRSFRQDPNGRFEAANSVPRVSPPGRHRKFERGGSSRWPDHFVESLRHPYGLPLNVKFRGAADSRPTH